MPRSPLRKAQSAAARSGGTQVACRTCHRPRPSNRSSW
jgi:hypothetical protein